MKIAIIGAAGVRTPLIVQAILKRQDILALTELSLMDIDGEHLELIGALTAPLERAASTHFHISRTTDPRKALNSADFVITTFRVGGIDSRVIDERVPLAHGLLGQETTGPGGFAMGIRSIPVILDYVKLMQEVCPDAWLINFANPAGMLTEAIIRNTPWQRVVGICDSPSSMHQVIAASLNAKPIEIMIDYFGLNHLGWIKRVIYQNRDILPGIIQNIKNMGRAPGLPFDTQLIACLGMLPNEYLYYYYYANEAINNIHKAGESRGEQIARQNKKLFAELKEKLKSNDLDGMQASYQAYLDERGSTYMLKETGNARDLSVLNPEILKSISDEGYAGVALNLIKALSGKRSGPLILNIPARGAINALDQLDVVEIPTLVEKDQIKPIPVDNIPDHCMGLVLQVKQYERWTIEAAVEGSYQKARLALTSHPLVRDYSLAGLILDEYLAKHHGYFPVLR
jgi:6-phospho-beta-glucosidase